VTKLIFVRHGHVEGLDPERFRGRLDLPLTALGQRQILATAQAVAATWRPAAIYSSPLKRTRDTAGAVAQACGSTCNVLPDLNDIDYGVWQGQTHSDIKKAEPNLYARWFAAPHLMRFPSGESLQDVVARAAGVLFDVVARYGEETVVLVSHDSVGRALLLQLLDQPLSAYWRLTLSPCSISVVDIVASRTSALAINDIAHLRDC
jgi:probable phosphoglycerate mutase